MNKTSFIVLLSMLSIAAIGVNQWLSSESAPQTPSPRETAKKPVAVITAPVTSQSLQQELSLIGKLEAYQSVWVAPQITGKIATINTKENQQVKQGDLLLSLEDSRARATVAEAEAYLADQQRKLNDFIKLSHSNAITQSEIDAQRTQVDIASARLSAASSDLNYHYLRAPFTGHTGLIDFSEGKMVNAGTELLTIDNLSRLKLDIAVPEKYLSQLHIGMAITASSDAWPQQVFNGKVNAIDPRVDANSLNITIRVEFQNPDTRLMPGMMMKALLAFQPVTAPAIPVQALEYSGTKRFVYVVNDQQQVSRQQVVLSHRIDDSVLIESGLKVGDEIVVQGLVNMRDGISIHSLKTEAAPLSQEVAAKPSHGVRS
ncbi:efflux RND transporter periplasmic adaptor subunit [Shewanella sp. NIFS-20-20]|uniref:efflux RND transporter periplasmic adaptor subunit n=1 Tax=Shewanella sp. NIFS-20-20 TaxID=2853806 RepID=UPI001C449736|nr:efflux RND transporter periplasmic adaptor subunit [Shewanella sp. NIFS-20-20]MBV7314968.1 efflux RND transporter periplasmic adaptor subunit [Shewanella sp. NIFS-20-20]